MKLEWSILPEDLDAVRRVLEATSHVQMVLERKRNNVEGKAPQFSGAQFWRVMVGCLLSTQQRSGPGSAVVRFLERRPFPLEFEDCQQGTIRLPREAQKVLEDHGGIRRAPTIASQLAENLAWLNAGGWPQAERVFEDLLSQRSRGPVPHDFRRERDAARFVDENLKGFGPKQSRNLWQDLGLTRYEIPLDSRITDWVNENGVLPFKLTAGALADRAYYELVMGAVQELCHAAGVLPCILDAAVFSIKDQTD